MRIESVSRVDTKLPIERNQPIDYRKDGAENAKQVVEKEAGKEELRTVRADKKSALTKDELYDEIQAIKTQLTLFNHRFEYRVHEGTESLMVDIVDRQNDKVIKSIPPEHLLDISAKVRAFVGLMIDEIY